MKSTRVEWSIPHKENTEIYPHGLVTCRSPTSMLMWLSLLYQDSTLQLQGCLFHLRAWSLSWPDHKALSTPLSSLKLLFSNWQGWAQELLHITSRAPQNLQLSASREFRCTKLSGWWQPPRVTRKPIVNGSLVSLNVISQSKYTQCNLSKQIHLDHSNLTKNAITSKQMWVEA
jgi:hypothetical protein